MRVANISLGSTVELDLLVEVQERRQAGQYIYPSSPDPVLLAQCNIYLIYDLLEWVTGSVLQN